MELGYWLPFVTARRWFTENGKADTEFGARAVWIRTWNAFDCGGVGGCGDPGSSVLGKRVSGLRDTLEEDSHSSFLSIFRAFASHRWHDPFRYWSIRQLRLKPVFTGFAARL